MSPVAGIVRRSRRRSLPVALGHGFLLLLIFAASPPTFAQRADLPLEAVAGMDIEELMGVGVLVTSVAGVPRGVFHTASAITVLTRDDVVRTGDRTLPGALRVVPGMLAARTHSHAWRVGARGFTGGLANKNLVLVDGRAVWDPLFGGVFWDAQDVVFEDLDRIEVIRGPGATLWGANAMNSVINVITRSARDTQGWYATAGAGSHARRVGAVRYGGQAAENAWFRVHAKYVDYDGLVDADGRSTGDEWSMLRGGFRLDALLRDDLDFTLQADAHRSLEMGEVVNVPVAPGTTEQRATERRVRGANVLARFGRSDDSGNGWTFQTYYQNSFRRQAAGLEVDRNSADLDFRRFSVWGDGHELIWGAGYFVTSDRTEAGPTAAFDPADRTLQTLSAFVQNTFVLQPERWFAMLGTKFEHNEITGFEVQPSIRTWHVPGQRHMVWGAISSPVRVPTRTALDSFLTLALLPPVEPGGPFVPAGVRGNKDLDAERLIAYELGHRFRASPALMLETAVFFNDYSRLIFVTDPIIGGQFTSGGSGRSYGGELELSWRATDRWRLAGGYGYASVTVRGPILRSEEGSHPRHMAHLRSFLDIRPNLELNAVLQYVDDMPAVQVPDYTRLDLGITWRPGGTWELSVWGQNLLHSSHREATFREFERSFYVRAALRY
jgi:iron complex outermembrane recepter protein